MADPVHMVFHVISQPNDKREPVIPRGSLFRRPQMPENYFELEGDSSGDLHVAGSVVHTRGDTKSVHVIRRVSRLQIRQTHAVTVEDVERLTLQLEHDPLCNM